MLAFAFVLSAQNISSGLSGTIVDQSDAIIPGAQVIARQSRTGFQKGSTSNEAGYFSIPDLSSGQYTISIEHGGFKKYQQTEIPLNSGEQRTLGRIKLQVGETAETVTVEAAGAQVQLGSSEKSASITQEEFPTRLVVTDPTLSPTERFRAPARGELGNLGTNSFRGPGFLNHDLSVYRNFKWERVNTQLRFESYNSLNHTQFSGPSTGTRFNTVGSTEQIDPLFLEPTSARNQRRIQIAIRVTF